MASDRSSTSKEKASAKSLSQKGLRAYADWDVEKAVEYFEAASQAAPDVSDYHLKLAMALSRAGDFDKALRSLAEFLRLKPDSEVAERFHRMFASGLDSVESIITEKMTVAQMPIEEIGAAMQMWLEYRISIGREPLVLRKPETWAGALDYTVRKVNLREVTYQEIGELYDVSERTLRERFEKLVDTLDVMPCDYRYFVGKENPLDKLVEAAELLEQLEARFHDS